LQEGPLTTRIVLVKDVCSPEAVVENLIRPKLVPIAPIPQETPLDEYRPGEPAQPTHFFLLDELDLQALQISQHGEPIDKRIAVAGHLKPLTEQETRSYVELGLEAKGWKNEPEIEEPVFHIIHQFSEGVPSRINIICNNLLLQCFIDRRRRITGADAIALMKELPVEKPSIYNRCLSEESPPLPPHSEARAEEQIVTEPAPKDCAPIESLMPAPLVPADTSISTTQRAHFGPLNSSLANNRARRGKW
jgi:hypothetical protein